VNVNQNALKTALKQWQHLRNALAVAHPKPVIQKALENKARPNATGIVGTPQFGVRSYEPLSWQRHLHQSKLTKQ